MAKEEVITVAKTKPRLIVIDNWAFALAKELAEKYGLRASEIYAGVTEANKSGYSKKEIRVSATKICYTASELGWGFTKTCRWLEETLP